MKYNERKVNILEIINNANYPITSREITKKTNVSLSCITALLKRYHDFGYVRRKKNDNNKYIYSLNKKGVKTLNYLLKVIKEE